MKYKNFEIGNNKVKLTIDGFLYQPPMLIYYNTSAYLSYYTCIFLGGFSLVLLSVLNIILHLQNQLL